MKIFAIVHNYESLFEDSVKEPVMGRGEEPVWYEIPDSAILRTGNPFFVPDFDAEFHAFPSLCLRVGRLGKGIAPRFADRYIDGWTMGVAVAATGLLGRLRESGLPWTRAVAFDRCCMLGNLQPADTLYINGRFRIACAGSVVCYDTACLRRGVAGILSDLSQDNTLKTGDMILAGLMPRGLALLPGTRLEVKADHDNSILIDINIK